MKNPLSSSYPKAKSNCHSMSKEGSLSDTSKVNGSALGNLKFSPGIGTLKT